MSDNLFDLQIMNRHREYYHRHLPHWQPSGATFFVTFRLKGSLPFEVIQVLQEERGREWANLSKLSKDEQAKQNYLDERRYFGKWDGLLDKAEFGPRWLSQPEIAEIVKEALYYRDGREYDLFAFCIMSNHVHTVFATLERKSDWQSDLHAPLERKPDWQSDLHALLERKPDWQSDLQTSSYPPLNKIMQSLKRQTARKSNIVLGRDGTFWQDESYTT
jgi:putative transposase